jgi:cell division protein FtsQ
MAKKKKSYQESCEQLAFMRRMRIWSRRAYKLSFIAAVILLVAFGFYVYNYDKNQTFLTFFRTAYYNLTAKTGLRLERVTFEGDKYLGQEELVETLGLLPDKPILAFNLEELRSEIKKESWVQDAQVQRKLPSRINIIINERKPIAIWFYNEKYYLIDGEGVVLTEVDSPDVLPFPMVAGEQANTEAEKIFALLSKQKPLFDQMQSAERMGERRWNIIFMNGIEVMLPEKNMDIAWEKLAQMQQQNQVLERQIKSIDLRLPDRIYIKTLDGKVIKNVYRSNNA